MGEGDKQGPRHGAKLVKAGKPASRDARERSRPPDPRAAEPRAAEPERKGLAAGTLPVQNAPLMSRTSTLADPLTTSLLAEISRRSRTIEVSADQIAEAQAIEPADPEEIDPFAELQAELDAEPADDPPPQQPKPRR
jgi:hypothetical protein